MVYRLRNLKQESFQNGPEDASRAGMPCVLHDPFDPFVLVYIVRVPGTV